MITDKATAKEAWDSVAMKRIGDGRVKKNAAQQLRREFELTAFKDGKTVEEYALRLTSIQATMQTLGDPL